MAASSGRIGALEAPERDPRVRRARARRDRQARRAAVGPASASPKASSSCSPRVPAATAAAARDFVYRLPNLDVPLRVEDVGEGELVIDCGEQDLVRVERYLKANADRRLRLTLDSDETDRQIDREARTLREAAGRRPDHSPDRRPDPRAQHPARGPRQRSSTRISIPASSRSSRPRSPPTSCSSCRARRGPGKTTTICEIVRQALAKDPHAQILSPRRPTRPSTTSSCAWQKQTRTCRSRGSRACTRSTA